MLSETAVHSSSREVNATEFICPVCGSSGAQKLSLSWKKYHDEKQFCWSNEEWFCACEPCGTVFRAPLKIYKDFKEYGRNYYDLVNQGQSVEEHAEWHYKTFQKKNYDVLHRFLLKELPAETYPKWLDVGSIGYATTLKDYNFQTIEPDSRIVKLGRRLFAPKLNFFRTPKIHCATLETYPTNEQFDGIVFNNSFYCVTTPLETLRKAAALLREGGALVISISTYLNDAVAMYADGRVSRIEDVLPGETFWVFYNRYALEYLCAKAGFRFEDVRELSCYGKKTMQVYRFKKVAVMKVDEDLLGRSRDHMKQKFDACFDAFHRETLEALNMINNPSSVVVTTAALLKDVLECHPLDQVGAITLYDEDDSNHSWPVSVLTRDELIKKYKGNPSAYKVIDLSFKYQDDIYAWVRQTLGEKFEVLRPNRKSGMEQLFFEFAGQRRPCKEVHFTP